MNNAAQNPIGPQSIDTEALIAKVRALLERGWGLLAIQGDKATADGVARDLFALGAEITAYSHDLAHVETALHLLNVMNNKLLNPAVTYSETFGTTNPRDDADAFSCQSGVGLATFIGNNVHDDLFGFDSVTFEVVNVDVVDALLTDDPEEEMEVRAAVNKTSMIFFAMRGNGGVRAVDN